MARFNIAQYSSENPLPLPQKDFIAWLRQIPVDKWLIATNFKNPIWDIDLPEGMMRVLKSAGNKGLKNVNQIAQSPIMNYIRLDSTKEKIKFIKVEDLWKLCKNFSAYQVFDTLQNDILYPNLTESGPHWTEMKPGKAFKAIFPKASPQDCEEFVEAHKMFLEAFLNPTIDEVSGDELVELYQESNYVYGDGPLQNSCMRHDDSQAYISRYSDIDIEMVVLRDPEEPEKIRARALLWRNVHFEDIDDGDRKALVCDLMDRIYFTTEDDKIKLMKYAEKKGYAYKAKQSMDAYAQFKLPIDGYDFTFHSDVSFTTNVRIDPEEMYPYVDTFFNVTLLGDLWLNYQRSDTYECRELDGKRSGMHYEDDDIDF